MKSKAMVFVIGCMFLLGMAGNALAVNDSIGEQLGTLDLATASVVTYSKPSSLEIPDFAKVGVTMAAGSHLPGAIIFDFDVDNDPATGGGSVITGIPSGNCGGPCKTPAGDGFDFYMVLVLRTQGDSSNLSLVSGCSGSSLPCVERGAPSACDEGTCYALGSPVTSAMPIVMKLKRAEHAPAAQVVLPLIHSPTSVERPARAVNSGSSKVNGSSVMALRIQT